MKKNPLNTLGTETTSDLQPPPPRIPTKNSSDLDSAFKMRPSAKFGKVKSKTSTRYGA